MSIVKITKELKINRDIVKKVLDKNNIKMRDNQYKENLTNKIIGDFTVISFDNTKGKYKYYWICKCNNCGKEKSIATTSLTNINKRNICECNKKFKFPEKIKGYAEDLTNKTFGKLKVLKYDSKQHSHSKWVCECECGNIIVKSISFLNNSKFLMCDNCKKLETTTPKVKTEYKEKQYYQQKLNKIEYYDEHSSLINDTVVVDNDDVPLILSYGRYVTINNGGYALMWWKNSELFIHRLVMGLPQRYDTVSKLISDHKDGNRLDCRKQNLRVCKKELNPINCKTYKNNTSGKKGISWNKKLNKWQVNLQHGGKNNYLGVYINFQEAVQVRKDAEIKFFGEFNRKEN